MNEKAVGNSAGPDVTVNVAGIEMKNPVMVASGTFGYGSEYADLVDLNALGAVVVKGICSVPWEGNDVPRMVEVPGGLVNAIGLQGPGMTAFAEKYMPFLRQFDTPVIVNIWGRTLEEYGEVAAGLDGVEGIDGLELNISCPNVKEGGIAFGADRNLLKKVVARVREKTRLPVITKLAPNVPDIGEYARIVEGEGGDALSLINTLPAMVIDTETRRPVLSNIVGGLSGPAIHPVAVKLVWEACRAVRIPIVGMGGITESAQAVEFMLAGATAVAVGTANFTDPTTVLRVIDGISDYLQRHGFSSARELRGRVEIPGAASD